MNGFLIANKPTGITSSNLVVFVRKRLPRGTAIGHGGTLDPEASGVLPLCIGSATRLFDYIIDKKKTYVAELQLGAITDTQDATGSVIETRAVHVTENDLRGVLGEFVGEIAYHFDGEKHLADVIVYAPYRRRGYGAAGLALLCAAAKESPSI